MKSSNYIPTLDGWRCVAILLVIFAHSWSWLGFGTTKLARVLHYPDIGIHIQRSGMTGVGVFFCLSGFLITRRLVEQHTSLKSFYVRRVFRILPPALAYLTCIGLVGALGVVVISSQEIFASILFYRNYLDRNAWFTGHFWSLSIEEQYYLVWPSVLAIAGFKRSRLVALLGALGVVVWRQLHWPLPDFAYFHTGMRLDSILCGSAMALSWPALKPIVQKIPPVAILASLILFITADRWAGKLQGSTDFVQAMLICLLMAGTVATPSSFASRILEVAPIAWLGRMSYSIYLWQQLFLFPAHKPHWQLPLRLIGIIGTAWLSFNFVERPMIATGRRLLARWEPVPKPRAREATSGSS